MQHNQINELLKKIIAHHDAPSGDKVKITKEGFFHYRSLISKTDASLIETLACHQKFSSIEESEQQQSVQINIRDEHYDGYSIEFILHSQIERLLELVNQNLPADIKFDIPVLVRVILANLARDIGPALAARRGLDYGTLNRLSADLVIKAQGLTLAIIDQHLQKQNNIDRVHILSQAVKKLSTSRDDQIIIALNKTESSYLASVLRHNSGGIKEEVSFIQMSGDSEPDCISSNFSLHGIELAADLSPNQKLFQTLRNLVQQLRTIASSRLDLETLVVQYNVWSEKDSNSQHFIQAVNLLHGQTISVDGRKIELKLGIFNISRKGYTNHLAQVVSSKYLDLAASNLPENFQAKYEKVKAVLANYIFGYARVDREATKLEDYRCVISQDHIEQIVTDDETEYKEIMPQRELAQAIELFKSANGIAAYQDSASARDFFSHAELNKKYIDEVVAEISELRKNPPPELAALIYKYYADEIYYTTDYLNNATKEQRFLFGVYKTFYQNLTGVIVINAADSANEILHLQSLAVQALNFAVFHNYDLRRLDDNDAAKDYACKLHGNLSCQLDAIRRTGTIPSNFAVFDYAFWKKDFKLKSQLQNKLSLPTFASLQARLAPYAMLKKLLVLTIASGLIWAGSLALTKIFGLSSLLIIGSLALSWTLVFPVLLTAIGLSYLLYQKYHFGTFARMLKKVVGEHKTEAEQAYQQYITNKAEPKLFHNPSQACSSSSYMPRSQVKLMHHHDAEIQCSPSPEHSALPRSQSSSSELDEQNHTAEKETQTIQTIPIRTRASSYPR